MLPWGPARNGSVPPGPSLTSPLVTLENSLQQSGYRWSWPKGWDDHLAGTGLEAPVWRTVCSDLDQKAFLLFATTDRHLCSSRECCTEYSSAPTNRITNNEIMFNIHCFHAMFSRRATVHARTFKKNLREKMQLKIQLKRNTDGGFSIYSSFVLCMYKLIDWLGFNGTFSTVTLKI